MAKKGSKMINIGSLLLDAATLMVTGMTVVFLFLTIMVYLVSFMSRMLPKEEPKSMVAPKRATRQQLQDPSAVNSQVVAAIAAAVHQHRSSAAK
jgi:oxaloacetate decarboxylase (Na+ extruding) subunit gamma